MVVEEELMIKFTNLLKSYVLRWYVLLIIFCIGASANLAIGKVVHNNAGNTTPLITLNYTSVAQMSVYKKGESFLSQSDIINYVTSLTERLKGEVFANEVLNEVKTSLENEQVDIDENFVQELKNLEYATFKDIFLAEMIGNSNSIKFSLTYKNAKCAQYINSCAVNRAFEILIAGDNDNIISTSIITKQLGFKIDTSAQLPVKADANKDQAPPLEIKSLGKMSIVHIAVLSLFIWLLVVAIYDFAVGYLTNLHKAKTFVQTDIVSEIIIPMRACKQKTKEEK